MDKLVLDSVNKCTKQKGTKKLKVIKDKQQVTDKNKDTSNKLNRIYTLNIYK